MTELTVKLLGAALLTGAGALLGWNRTRDLRRRLALLRELSGGLGLLSDELTALRTPLPSILEALRDRPFFELLRASFGTAPLPELWTRAAHTLELDRADRETLAALGAVVGRYDAEQQAAEIAAVRRRLDERGLALEAEIAGRAKNYTALGASFGAIAAVMLL